MIKWPWHKPNPQSAVEQMISDVAEESVLLSKDIVTRELNLIDAQHKLAAQQEKLSWILKYLDRTRVSASSSSNPGEEPSALSAFDPEIIRSVASGLDGPSEKELKSSTSTTECTPSSETSTFRGRTRTRRST